MQLVHATVTSVKLASIVEPITNVTVTSGTHCSNWHSLDICNSEECYIGSVAGQWERRSWRQSSDGGEHARSRNPLGGKSRDISQNLVTSSGDISSIL